MPYEALIGSSAGAFNYSSPQGISDMSPASDTIVATPSSAMSPPSAPSPTAVAIKRKTAMERAKLFVQGRHDALLADMNRTERRYA